MLVAGDTVSAGISLSAAFVPGSRRRANQYGELLAVYALPDGPHGLQL